MPPTPAQNSARERDAASFERLVAPHQPGLEAHCYRMLGSAADAEDALQETLLRAWRGLSRFEGRSSLRSWLYTIATNVCLRALEQRSRRSLPVDLSPAADPSADLAPRLVEQPWMEPFAGTAQLEEGPAGPATRYEQRESVELAFIAALQHLPARQRAVLLLRDVLGLAPAEIADALETTPTSVYSMLQRAHQAVDDRLPQRSQQATLRAIGDARLREVVERYVSAWERNDIAALTAMLTHDAVMAMPPVPAWFHGPEAIGAFLARWPMASERSWRMVPTELNGQVAFATYDVARPGPEGPAAHGVQVLTLAADGSISQLMAFLDPVTVTRAGLPAALPMDPAHAAGR